MSTQLFLHILGSGGNADRFGFGGDPNFAAQPLPLRTFRAGGVQVGTNTATNNGPTAGVQALDAQGFTGGWLSQPLDADVTISGTVTLNVWMAESSMTANVGAQIIIERVDSQGVLSTILNSEKGVELPLTTRAVQNWTAVPTSTQFFRGDRIRITVYGNDAGGTMAGGFTFNMSYAGGTAAADGDSFVTFTENFGFLGSDPTTTSLYTTDTTGQVNPNSANSREISLSRGAGAQSEVINTLAGFRTNPGIQLTTEWFSRKLQAFTLSAPVLANMRGLESNAAANAALRCELAVCDSAGANPTVWANTCAGAELGTSESAHVFYLAGADTAVATGSRLRMRVFVDDAINAMGTGQTVTFFYAGATPGASGDSFLTLGQTLTEYTPSGLFPRKDRRIVPQLVPEVGW